jgi:hypothetical protein
MNKGVAIHYILVIAGLILVIGASYLIYRDHENLISKLIVAFAGLFVIFSQYLLIKIKNKK